MGKVDTKEKRDVVETIGKAGSEATIARNTPKTAEVVKVEATPIALQPVMRFDERMLQVIKDTVGSKLDNAELRLFIATCERTGLDPIARQIYAVKRYDRREGREVMSIQTGIDGFRLIAERSTHYQGQRGPWWCGPDQEWQEVWLSDTPPAAAKIGVVRDDFSEPLYAVATFKEYAQHTKDGHLSGLWNNMPANQIAKCAESLALRRAFPNELSGLYTTEEMQQADAAAKAGSGDGVARPVGVAPSATENAEDSTMPERPRDANRTGYADAALATARRQEGEAADKPVPFTDAEKQTVRDRIRELIAEHHPVLAGGFKKYMDANHLSYTGTRGTTELWSDNRHLGPLREMLGIAVEEPKPAEFDPTEAPA